MLGGCRSAGDDGGRPVRAVATTTQVADLVERVGGDRVAVHRILAPNSDPHQYEPRPSDAAAVSRARLVFQSGGDLDRWLDGVVGDAGGGATVVKLIDSVRTRRGPERGSRETDPHWWQDPRNAERAVRRIAVALAAADPAGARGYARNARAYRHASGASTAASPRASPACRRPSAGSSRPTTRSATTPPATASGSSVR